MDDRPCYPRLQRFSRTGGDRGGSVGPAGIGTRRVAILSVLDLIDAGTLDPWVAAFLWEAHRVPIFDHRDRRTEWRGQDDAADRPGRLLADEGAPRRSCAARSIPWISSTTPRSILRQRPQWSTRSVRTCRSISGVQESAGCCLRNDAFGSSRRRTRRQRRISSPSWPAIRSGCRWQASPGSVWSSGSRPASTAESFVGRSPRSPRSTSATTTASCSDLFSTPGEHSLDRRGGTGVVRRRSREEGTRRAWKQDITSLRVGTCFAALRTRRKMHREVFSRRHLNVPRATPSRTVSRSLA